MKIYKCDRCGRISENPEKDGFCRILVYKGMHFWLANQGSKYTHHHFCKKCKKELFKK